MGRRAGRSLGRAISHPVIARLMAVTFLAGSAFMGIEFVFGFGAQRASTGDRAKSASPSRSVGIVAAFCQIFVTGRLSERFGEAACWPPACCSQAVAIGLQPFAHGIGCRGAARHLRARPVGRVAERVVADLAPRGDGASGTISGPEQRDRRSRAPHRPARIRLRLHELQRQRAVLSRGVACPPRDLLRAGGISDRAS
jgi:hypothetical protein